MGKEITVAQEFKGNLGDYQGIVFRTEMKAEIADGADAEALAYMKQYSELLVREMVGIQGRVLKSVLQEFHGAGFSIKCLSTVAETYLNKEVES